MIKQSVWPWLSWGLVGVSVLGVVGCSTPSSPTHPSSQWTRELKATSFSSLPVTQTEDWGHALKAFQVSCRTLKKKSAWKAVCQRASTVSPVAAKTFFESAFTPYQVWQAPPEGTMTTEGLMTGYYEPMLLGSLKKEGPYQYPLYGTPPDLIEVNLASVYPQLKGLKLRGKLKGNKLVPYDDRAGIEGRADLQNSILCYVDDPVEAAFLQIQGSGRVKLPDGQFLRLGYDQQNGYPYQSLATWLIRHEGLKREEMSMQRIKAWAKANPEKTPAMLNANRNYVFFAKRTGYRDDEGPIGAQGVPLTPQASVAVDRRFWPMGMPFVVDIEQARPDMKWTRPVIAQDTGGAIRGPVRFDYFWGYGPQAGESAGRQKSHARAWVLIPKGQTLENLR